MAIAQLQTLTSYSLLASTNRMDDLIQKAKEYGYVSLAITDKNVMYGVAEFYQKCKKNDIHPIIGLTIEYQRTIEETATYPLILLAKNQTGYENLIKISTMKMELTHQEFFIFDDFKDLLHDLVVIFPDEHSELNRLFENKQLDEIKEIIKGMEQVVDEESLYIGISITEADGIDSSRIDYLRQLGKKLVALQDVRYLYPSDDFTLKVLKNIDEGTKLSEESIKQTGPYYLSTVEMMEEKFSRYGLEKALENTVEIGNKCQFEMEFNQTLLPHYDVPTDESASDYLKRLCLENLPKRIKDVTKEYEDRLKMELDVIHEMGFDDYFLIIWDVMNFAANNKIVTGAGRGSAAGSLVAYVLKITDVDPIQYHLLFERFLNKERFTMPDIDLDLPDNRREEVLLYVNEKYGHHHVAQIATFGTMAA